MRLRRLKLWVGAVLLALLSGCSAIRLAYDTGPTLAWWWLDGYGDFSGDSAARVKEGIRQWFSWHRTTQLTDYAQRLSGVRARIGDSITPAQVCRWWEEARNAVEPALDRALVAGATVVPTLTEAQLRHLEQRYAKNADEMRRDFLQPDPVKRHEAALKRTLDRVEMLYGRLDDAQVKLVSDGIKASPFDPEAWWRERQSRQRDTVQTLRRLVQDKADNDRVLAALRALAERTERSPDPAYRAYQLRLREYNCAFGARIHNAMNTRQRQAAQAQLEAWDNDLRALAANPAGGAAPVTP